MERYVTPNNDYTNKPHKFFMLMRLLFGLEFFKRLLKAYLIKKRHWEYKLEKSRNKLYSNHLEVINIKFIFNRRFFKHGIIYLIFAYWYFKRGWNTNNINFFFNILLSYTLLPLKIEWHSGGKCDSWNGQIINSWLVADQKNLIYWLMKKKAEI